MKPDQKIQILYACIVILLFVLAHLYGTREDYKRELFKWQSTSQTQSPQNIQAPQGTQKEINEIRDVYFDCSNKLSELQQSASLTRQSYDSCLTEKNSITQERDALQLKYSQLIPIQSFKIMSEPSIYYNPKTVLYGTLTCTGSMNPSIECDDITLRYKPLISDIDVGDVVTYTVQDSECGSVGQRIIHRVKRVTSQDGVVKFETKGDANFFSDKCLIPFSWIDSKVYAIIKESSVG